MFDEECDESLETPEDGSVNDDRAVFSVILTDVLELKALGKLVVQLDRCTLPVSPDGVHDVEVDLRTVKVSLSLGNAVGLSRAFQGLLELVLGLVPCLGGAQEGLWSCREFDRKLKLEICIDLLHESKQAFYFVADLIWRDETVGIILAELPCTREAGKNPGGFVAMEHALVVIANRQISIAAYLAGKYEHVPWAVHGLQAVGLAL